MRKAPRPCASRTALPFVAALALGACLAPSAARAEGASGFLLQGVLGGGTSVIGIGPPGAGTRDNPFTAMPALRIGGMFRALAIAGNLAYFSSAALRNGQYTGGNVLTVGPDIMPFVWRGAGGSARLYLLFGLNVGAVMNTQSGSTAANVTGGFTFGAGGNYFLHPNFALGVELGSRTQFTPADGTLLATSTLYAALTGSFVAGR